MTAGEAVIYLLGCAVNGATPDRARLTGLDLDEVYAISRRHMLSACVGMMLEAAGFRDDRSSRAIAESLHRMAAFDAAQTGICRRLESASIWYSLVK